MPCHSPVPDRIPATRDDVLDVASKILDRMLKKSRSSKKAPTVKKELDLVTRLLCCLLKKNPSLAKTNKTLAAWWKLHKKWDRKRKEKPKKKRQLRYPRHPKWYREIQELHQW